MTIETCEDRQIIKVSGKDNEAFLNNIATNNVKQDLTYAEKYPPHAQTDSIFEEFLLIYNRCYLSVPDYK